MVFGRGCLESRGGLILWFFVNMSWGCGGFRFSGLWGRYRPGEVFGVVGSGVFIFRF